MRYIDEIMFLIAELRQLSKLLKDEGDSLKRKHLLNEMQKVTKRLQRALTAY